MHEDSFKIRVPLKMMQQTDTSGNTWPVAFEWPDTDGASHEVRIDRVVRVTPQADQKSGAVGDRYECMIEGKVQYIYYTKLTPRKWFLIVPATQEEYNSYYKLPTKGQ